MGFQPSGEGSQTYAFRSGTLVSCLVMKTADVEITLRAGHNLATSWCNVYPSHSFVMSSEFIFQLELSTCLAVEVDVVLAGYSQRLTVGGEGMVRDGVVEEVVDFRSHNVYVLLCAIGGALYYCVGLVTKLVTLGGGVASWLSENAQTGSWRETHSPYQRFATLNISLLSTTTKSQWQLP